jgi:hypothetical protein
MNKIRIGWMLALGLMLLIGAAAHAQQHIGNGIYACDGAAQAGPCQPEGEDDSPSSGSSEGYTDNDYAHAPPKWETRWGAIATDAEHAKLGVVIAASNKRMAELGALEDCKNKGGSNCKLQLSYYNQCAAMVVGDRVMNTGSAATLEEAKQMGLSECQKDDSNCRVYYSGCSLPERVQ